LQFVAPKFVFVELFKHAPKIQKATKLSRDEVLELLSGIVNRIKFYEEDLISIGNWIEAFRLCRDVDEKDTTYIAS
jgi:predicted nucleic acid-binding protein